MKWNIIPITYTFLWCVSHTWYDSSQIITSSLNVAQITNLHNYAMMTSCLTLRSFTPTIINYICIYIYYPLHHNTIHTLGWVNDICISYASHSQWVRDLFGFRELQQARNWTHYEVITQKRHPPLQWRNNEHDGVSNRQPHDCLLKRLFRYRWKKTSKLRFIGLCEGNSPVIDEFPAQRASNAENVSIWWCHQF